MKRRNFLRDIALGIAATIVPKILQPVIPEIAIPKCEISAEFEGIIPAILKFKGGVVDYTPDNYNFEDMKMQINKAVAVETPFYWAEYTLNS